jgi:hypothetical protein
MPANAARTSGSRCGVRSPSRYGAHSSPSLPAGILVRRRRQRRRNLPGKERLLQPAQAQPRRLRYAHHVPQPRHRVAEGVQPSLGILGRRGRGGKHHSRGPDGRRNRTRLQIPMPTAPAPWSPAPATTGVPAASPVSPARRLADARADLRRLVDLGQPALGIPAASATSRDQRRCVTSSSSVPEASCTSMANSPVSR